MSEQNPGVSGRLAAGLYVVATPIGNLNDITIRALEVLKAVDCIAAEDTRHTRTLLAHFGIDKPLLSLHDHNETQRIERLLERLRGGESLALVSDAGTPLISDPGFKLVRALREAGIAIVPVPGACAAIAALSVAGLPTDRFRFIGFLPARRQARIAELESLCQTVETTVFYESPRRIVEFLEDVVAVMGEGREVAVAKELTKLFERVFLGTASDALALFRDESLQRGEFVVLLSPAAPDATQSDVSGEACEMLRKVSRHLPPKQAAALVADLTGEDKKRLYQWWVASGRDE